MRVVLLIPIISLLISCAGTRDYKICNETGCGDNVSIEVVD